MPFSGIEAQDYSRLCTKRGLQLRVSYNIDPVFFKFNNDDVKQVAVVMACHDTCHVTMCRAPT